VTPCNVFIRKRLILFTIGPPDLTSCDSPFHRVVFVSFARAFAPNGRSARIGMVAGRFFRPEDRTRAAALWVPAHPVVRSRGSLAIGDLIFSYDTMVSEAEVDTVNRVRTECPTIHADGPIGLGFLRTIHREDGGYVDYPRSGLATGIPRIRRCRPSQVGLSPHDDDLPQPDILGTSALSGIAPFCGNWLIASSENSANFH
jgi:hypothetical protein